MLNQMLTKLIYQANWIKKILFLKVNIIFKKILDIVCNSHSSITYLIKAGISV